MVNLTKKELLSINGGHDGESYNAGVEVGKFITKAGNIDIFFSSCNFCSQIIKIEGIFPSIFI